MTVQDIDTGYYDDDEVQDNSDTVVSDLAAVAKLAQDRTSKPIRIKVKAMPGFSVQYRTDLEAADLERIFRKARRKVNGQVESDRNKAWRHVLAETCEGILQNGQPLTNSKGDRVTFGDLELMDEFDIRPANALTMVHEFFKHRDGEIEAHAARVLTTCGFGEDAEDDDASDPIDGD